MVPVPDHVPQVRTANPYQQRRGNEAGGDGDGDGGAPAGWRTHQQAFAADGARLCLCCSKPVPDCRYGKRGREHVCSASSCWSLGA